MKLKQAVALAKKYADVKGTDCGFDLIVLSPGWLTSGNAERGIRVACDEVTVSAAVNAVKLLDMVRKTPGDIKLTTKATTLHITGEGVAFELRGKAKLPRQPEPPARWATIAPDAVRAIAAVASLVGAEYPANSVRLTASWAATTQHNAVAVAWVAGLTKIPVTVPGKWWAKLKGAQDIGQVGGKVWLRDEAGTLLWVSAMNGEWPDSVIDHRVAEVRSAEGRAAFAIDGKGLATLCDRAFAAADSKADAYELTWRDGRMGVKGGGERGAFIGDIEAGAGGDNRRVGIEPVHFGGFTSAVQAVAGDKTMYLSMGGEMDPLMVWSVEPVALEALILPVFITAPA